MELRDVVIEAILEKKGDRVYDYDVRTLTPFVDHMIVVSTSNIRQNNAIAQNIKDRVREKGFHVDVRLEGQSDSRWLLIDLDEIVVHLFVSEERDVYQLDRLYADCPREVYDL